MLKVRLRHLLRFKVSVEIGFEVIDKPLETVRDFFHSLSSVSLDFGDFYDAVYVVVSSAFESFGLLVY